MVPIVSARCEHHHRRSETRGIIERADIDADQVGHALRLVVERRAALAAKSLALLGAAVGGSRMFDSIAGETHGGAGKHRDRRMAGAGVPLTVAALTLKASNRLRRDLVADRAADAAAGI